MNTSHVRPSPGVRSIGMKQLSPSPEAAAIFLRMPLAKAREKLASRTSQAPRDTIAAPPQTRPTLWRKR